MKKSKKPGLPNILSSEMLDACIHASFILSVYFMDCLLPGSLLDYHHCEIRDYVFYNSHPQCLTE